jgi:predicted GH43/DUF377 family glycosyl hydrolase
VPRVVLGPNAATGWEKSVSRAAVLKDGDTYRMWYSARDSAGSYAIGYATSPEGSMWTRMSEQPVLRPDKPWEKRAVMCPHVLWDGAARLFRMWYSAGESFEPDAIGYATSRDGLEWTKHESNPIFAPDSRIDWEKHRVTACQVLQVDGWHVMFYIGFHGNHAGIGIARSRDGVTEWQRNPANPIVRPGLGTWDADGCYKPFALADGGRWRLWYNGRRGRVEQIGLVTHEAEDLGFPSSPAALRDSTLDFAN